MRTLNGCEMAEEPATTIPSEPGENREEKPSLPVGVITALAFGAVVLVGLYVLVARQSGSQTLTGPSRDAVAYAEQLSVAELRMSAEENFLGQEVVYLDGKLANRGDKAVRQLTVRLYFRDTLNQVVLRDDQEVIKARSAPLLPGETREFRLLFDRIPDSWNQQVPQFQLLSLELQ